jgi:hypothetical protein
VSFNIVGTTEVSYVRWVVDMVILVDGEEQIVTIVDGEEQIVTIDEAGYRISALTDYGEDWYWDWSAEPQHLVRAGG